MTGPDEIMDALEVRFSEAVPELRYFRGFVGAEAVQAGEQPLLSMYDPTEAAELLRMGQRQQSWDISGLLATFGTTRLEQVPNAPVGELRGVEPHPYAGVILDLRELVEKMRQGLEADPTLGGLVDTCWLVLDSSAADANHGEGLLTITTLGVY